MNTDLIDEHCEEIFNLITSTGQRLAIPCEDISGFRFSSCISTSFGRSAAWVNGLKYFESRGRIILAALFVRVHSINPGGLKDRKEVDSYDGKDHH